MQKEYIEEIITNIKEYPTIILTAHKKPDGDALSSSYGLALAIKKTFPDKKVLVALNPNEIENRFQFLRVKKEMFINEENNISGKYLAIVGDTSTSSRIENLELVKNADFKICFDHHVSKADIKFDIFWSEPEYSASSLQAIQIANSLCDDFDQEIAFCLIIGVYTDTNNFRYSLAKSLPLNLVAKCLEYIDDKTMKIFFNKLYIRSKYHINIMKYAMKNIKYFNDFAYVIFTIKELKKYPKDINVGKFVNMISNIEGINKWCFFTQSINEDRQKSYNAHLRSNGYSLISIAKEYSGGGHHNAAGCILKSKEELKRIIFELAK